MNREFREKLNDLKYEKVYIIIQCMQIKTITNISFLIYKPVKIQMAQAHSYTVNGNTKWHFPSWEELAN